MTFNYSESHSISALYALLRFDSLPGFYLTLAVLCSGSLDLMETSIQAIYQSGFYLNGENISYLDWFHITTLSDWFRKGPVTVSPN